MKLLKDSLTFSQPELRNKLYEISSFSLVDVMFYYRTCNFLLEKMLTLTKFRCNFKTKFTKFLPAYHHCAVQVTASVLLCCKHWSYILHCLAWVPVQHVQVRWWLIWIF